MIDKLHQVVIAIPTYNEVESLPLIIERVVSAVPRIHIVIVDDNSPDGTGQLADRLAADNPRLHVIHRPNKRGLGPAYIHAFQWAKRQGYTWVGEMDADGSHRPEQLKRLIYRAVDSDDQPDLVIGSRWVRGGAVNGWAAHRQALSRAGNAYIGLWLDLDVCDATAGFRLYRLDLFDRINLDEVDSAGYCFQIDMTRRARHVDARIVEVPITFDERQLGQSKMSGSIITEALGKVTRWGIIDRWQQIMSKLSH